MISTIEIFCCYAHEDKNLLDVLRRHLAPLRRQGFIKVWHDREILPGTEWAREIDESLDKADIILLLISADFIDSDYCYHTEMALGYVRCHEPQGSSYSMHKQYRQSSLVPDSERVGTSAVVKSAKADFSGGHPVKNGARAVSIGQFGTRLSR